MEPPAQIPNVPPAPREPVAGEAPAAASEQVAPDGAESPASPANLPAPGDRLVARAPERRPSPDDTLVDVPAITDGPQGAAAAEPAAESAPWEELQDQHRDLPPPQERRSEFRPANDVERELLRAAAGNDHDLFLQTLADAELLMPVPDDMDYSLRPGRPDFPWLVREVDGAPVVPVFTSPERLMEAAEPLGFGREFIRLPFTTLLRYWPDQSHALAVNSGSPAGGTVVAQQLPGLARWADQRAARRLAEDFEPQNDVERGLFEAATRRDTDAFFKILLGAQVLVPAEPDTPWGITPDDPEFPWGPVRVHGTVSVQVFTSLKWMTEALGSSRFVMPSFQDMVSAWPDAEWTLVLNPGTPIDASLPGEQVRTLSGSAGAAPAPAAPPAAPAEPPAAPAEPPAAPADAPAVSAEAPASPAAPPQPPAPQEAPAAPASPAAGDPTVTTPDISDLISAASRAAAPRAEGIAPFGEPPVLSEQPQPS
ncbi:SseB family protein, partial [Actinomadura keratinilytica]|uniref:SseB family protein n=1 Tax=Actinomadura keratinilytica TaxID=547461 RepID=UPI0031E91A10